MRRVPLFLLFLIPFTAMTSAQTTAPFDPARSTTMLTASLTSLATPDMVVARVMSFDRNKDGRVVKSELPERMQNLLAGDVSGDGALDSAEIRALAKPAPPEALAPMLRATAPGARGGGGGGGYTFGDQVSLSTRSHVEGALEDLRLDAATHARALDIVRPFMDHLEADALAVLFNDVEGILSPAQLNNFKSAIHLQMRTTPQVITRPDGSTATFFMRRGPDPAQLLNVFGLPAEQKQAALNALENFKTRIRPGDADRTALLSGLKGVLGQEERDNFGAALQRRPLVKANGMIAGIVPGLPGRNLVPGPGFDGIEGPRVRRLLLTPERQVVEP